MAPTILVVGATGNTGKNVMRRIPELLQGSETMRDYKVIGLTRSMESATAHANLPNVEMLEKNWTTIDTAWLRDHEIARAFIAPHNGQTAFADESLLLTSMLEAGVKYVTRISTTPHNIGPASPIFYGRTHWAIENLLSQPEFKALQWTSLQPTVWMQAALSSAANWVQQYRQSGKKERFVTILSKEEPIAMLDAGDVGIIAAHLLAQDDPAPHNGARYTITGPEDFTGSQLVGLVQELAGTQVEDASFKNMDWLADLEKAGVIAGNLARSYALAPTRYWDGTCSLARMTTSPEVMDLAPPKNTPDKVFREMVNS